MVPFSRRALLGATGLLLLPAGPGSRAEAVQHLTAAPARQPLLGTDRPDTAIWAYNGASPGPVLRAPQGGTLRVRLENRLPQPTSIHWHGLRLPNAMDGVAGVTQPPVAPGAGFDYAFPLPDAGTHWYHPHWEAHEQVGRGLSGVLIVEEATPPAVDRDLLWVLGDWRLDAEGAITEDFGNMRDAMHAGRLGNLVTVNGTPRQALRVRAGERLRLRLVNVATARVFALRFTGQAPLVVALDGQPVEPHPVEDVVVLGPGMRADLVLDCGGSPGDREQVIDEAYGRQIYRLLDILYAPERLRPAPLRDAVRLPPNPVPEPDLARAERIPVVLHGGMMGLMRGGGAMRHAMAQGLAWTVNGRAGTDHARHEPMAELRLGRSYVLELRNETVWPHPMHLHGHAFRVLTRNGRPVPHQPFRDTVLLGPHERMDLAFVADNPGDWMLHCHVLEHHHTGMSALLRIG